MNAPHNVRTAEVIALVPAAQHSKTPNPKAWAKGNFRTTTADPDGTRPHTLSPEETTRHTRARVWGPPVVRRAWVRSQAAAAGFAVQAARRYSALMRWASSSWSSRMTMRQAASTGVPWSTSSRARAAGRKGQDRRLRLPRHRPPVHVIGSGGDSENAGTPAAQSNAPAAQSPRRSLRTEAGRDRGREGAGTRHRHGEEDPARGRASSPTAPPE